MKWFKPLVPVTLTLFLTACPESALPPVTPPADPTVFPVSEISGVIPNWTAGEAFVTAASGYGSSSDGSEETIDVTPPTFQGTLSETGAFTIPLQEPAESELFPLTCDAETYALGFVTLAVVSSTPQPTQPDEVLDVYTLGPIDSATQDAVWLCSGGELDLKCGFTEAHKNEFLVGILCEMLAVPRSSYYHARQRRQAPSERAKANLALLEQIKTVFIKHKGRYGSPRVHLERAKPGPLGLVRRTQQARSALLAGLSNPGSLRKLAATASSFSSAGGLGYTSTVQSYRPRPVLNQCDF